jgi:hypothetical protein
MWPEDGDQHLLFSRYVCYELVVASIGSYK